MGGTNIAVLAQIISSFAMIMSVIYLAKQIRKPKNHETAVWL